VARSIRSQQLETRTARLKLPVQRKPVFVKLSPGIHLGYRRNQTAGAWVVRCVLGGADWATRIGIADDALIGFRGGEVGTGSRGKGGLVRGHEQG